MTFTCWRFHIIHTGPDTFRLLLLPTHWNFTWFTPNRLKFAVKQPAGKSPRWKSENLMVASPKTHMEIDRWTNPPFVNRRFIFIQMVGMFHCHVSFPGVYIIPLQKQDVFWMYIYSLNKTGGWNVPLSFVAFSVGVFSTPQETSKVERKELRQLLFDLDQAGVRVVQPSRGGCLEDHPS